MRSFLRKALFPALVLVAAIGMTGAFSATVAIFTGPAGTNPVNQPQNLGDYNYILNGLNNNAAFAGNGQPSAVLGITQTTNAKLTAATTTAVQIVNSAVWTTVTGSSTCAATGAGWCLGVFDSNGVLRWLSGN